MKKSQRKTKTVAKSSKPIKGPQEAKKLRQGIEEALNSDEFKLDRIPPPNESKSPPKAGSSMHVERFVSISNRPILAPMTPKGKGKGRPSPLQKASHGPFCSPAEKINFPKVANTTS